jgi:hypothetical protein
MFLRELFMRLDEAPADDKLAKIKKLFPDVSADIDVEFTWATTNLKTNQGILWYLNLVEEWLKNEHNQPNNLQNLTGNFHLHDFGGLREKLDHYFASTYATEREISQYPKSISNKTIEQVLTELDEIEKVINKRNEQAIADKQPIPLGKGDKIVVPLKDGDWWLLPRHKCDNESKFMGHCGTASDKKNVLLSLRDKIPRPHLTFEYNRKEKELAQMKGKNNSKPQSAYHYAIFQLLMSDLVDSIYSGSTYQPATDFSIFDLKENLILEIHKTKPNLISDQINKYPIDFLRAPEQIRSVPEFYRLAIGKVPGIGALLSQEGELDDSNDAWQNAIEQDESIAIYAPDTIDNYQNLVIGALSEKTDLLGYAPAHVRNNFDIMKQLCHNKPDAIKYIQPTHKHYYELCKIAVSKTGYTLGFIPKESRSPELCKLAVTKSGVALPHVPEELKTPELCRIAVSQEGDALAYVPKELKTPELCKLAVSNVGFALYSVPQELKTTDLCEIAVSNDGLVLEYTPEELKTPELCKVAVSQNGMALRHVPNKLKTPELCKVAVSQNGSSLFAVPEELKTPELCKIAVSQDRGVLYAVPEQLRAMVSNYVN